jgi:RNA polymerase sigma-70 factor, ECF subfamily
MKEKEQNKIFEKWMLQYRALLFKVIRAYAFNEDDQNDLFQEITVQIWNSIPKFRGDSSPSTWLYRISLNTAIRWSGKEKKHQDGRHEIETVSHILQANDGAVDDRISWLYDEIKLMNEIDRSLTLLLLDGFSYKEMADMMGISESNIGVKIHRIKKQLVTRSEKYEAQSAPMPKI